MDVRRIALVALLLACAIGCNGGRDPWMDRPGPKVMAYFPPLYCLASTIAGDDAQVQSLITHVGPHHFEPTAQCARPAPCRFVLHDWIGVGRFSCA